MHSLKGEVENATTNLASVVEFEQLLGVSGEGTIGLVVTCLRSGFCSFLVPNGSIMGNHFVHVVKGSC